MSEGRLLHHADAPRRIGVIGAECSGKSTVAIALADRLPACLVTEALRDFVDQQGRTPRLGEQDEVFAEQVRREAETARRCTAPWVVADPAPLMTAVYSLAYFDDDRLLAPALAHSRGYEAVVWCDPAIPWQQDPGQRDGIHRRAQVHSLIAEQVIPALEGRGTVVLWASGTPDQRADSVAQWAWQRLAPHSAT